MKLAEALSLRADLQKKVFDLKNRIKNSAKIQEGDTPSENVEELFQQLNTTHTQLEEMIFRINKTNMNAVADGESLTQMMARKDVMLSRVKTLQEILEHCSNGNERYSRNEIRYVYTLNIAHLRKELEEQSKALRLLDLKIHGLNWSIELI